MITITSVYNTTVKKLKLLSTKKGRSRFGEFMAEGGKYVTDIPENWDVTGFYASETYYELNDIKPLCKRCEVVVLKDHIFNTVSDTETPQGIIAVVKQNEYNLEQITNTANPFVIIAENVQDPGNLGTIIRTADAAGANGVILIKDCVDLYNPKVVRSTAGSLFNIHCFEGELTQTMEFLKQSNIQTIATHLKGTATPYETNLTGGIALLIGNESKGLTDEASALCDTIIKLPMAGKAESLNASIASGIIMYEVLRQRMDAGKTII